jgi:plasmid stability protein
MAHQTLTLNIPDDLYQRLKRQAAFSRRTVEDELLNLATTALADNEIPPDIQAAVAALAQLDDEALWQAARTSKLSPRQSREIEQLHFKRQRDGLTSAEQQRLTRLMHQYDKALLVRAHAVGLLKDRGHDVNVLLEEP